MKYISGASSMDAGVNWSIGNSSSHAQQVVSWHPTSSWQLFRKALQQSTWTCYLSQVIKTSSKNEFRTQKCGWFLTLEKFSTRLQNWLT